MGVYTQLTQGKRYHIYAFMKAGFSQTAIAKEIGVHKSTVCRELGRNRGKKGYRPKQRPMPWPSTDAPRPPNSSS